mgnify:CR=1 FL=1
MRRPLEAGGTVHHIYLMENGQDGMDDALIGEILEPGSGEEQNRREQRVRKQFWSTVRKAARKVPFMEDVVAGYFCALDPKTPARVRGILLAALGSVSGLRAVGLCELPAHTLARAEALLGIGDDTRTPFQSGEARELALGSLGDLGGGPGN